MPIFPLRFFISFLLVQVDIAASGNCNINQLLLIDQHPKNYNRRKNMAVCIEQSTESGQAETNTDDGAFQGTALEVK